MDHVHSAEKEASEVLHSLLSVERIEKHTHNDNHQQVVVVTAANSEAGNHHGDAWNSPVFANMAVDQVLWHGHSVQIDGSGNICQDLSSPDLYGQVQSDPLHEGEKSPDLEVDSEETVPSSTKKRKTQSTLHPTEPMVLEDNALQVRERFDKGCECQEENCFKGLSAEYVYRHRLNIAELTKAEHDMYLMGVTMAVLTNPEETVRRKERRRLRAQYVFQGRRVCLDAFLYLENCTHYQLKRIRKHVMTHGVAPRVHGNHGKKPHNTFHLDIYTQATDFLKTFINQNSPQASSPQAISPHLHAALLKPKTKTARNSPLYLPAEITRKTIHNAYKVFCLSFRNDMKIMGYSTFRHFMKDQFPNIKFCKVEGNSNGKSPSGGVPDAKLPPKLQLHSLVQLDERTSHTQSIITSTGEVQQLTIPVVLSHNSEGTSEEQTTYIVTPVAQIEGSSEHQGFTQYQLTPAPSGYAVHQGSITMTNAQDDIMEDEELAVRDVVELLRAQFAIIAGGKSRDGCPIITFPDGGNFCSLGNEEYKRLILYLTSVPSMQEVDMGFVLVIDRRNDRWSAVKSVLLKISAFFPGLIHVAYVLRPSSFLQKAISEVSNKLFKEEFKFKVVVCSSADELFENVDRNQITQDLSGQLPYSHEEWLHQRESLEQFSATTKSVSGSLDMFTRSLQDYEFPNNVEATQLLLHSQGVQYNELKEEILSAAKEGETLLDNIRLRSVNSSPSNGNGVQKQLDLYRVCHASAVERLLVQLEETERTFDEFWLNHSARLRQCLDLRRFEQDFKELQANFDSHLKVVCDMEEVGDSVARVDALIKEASTFHKLCCCDVERAEELISAGHQLLNSRHYCPLECVQPKSSELQRMCQLLEERISARLATLTKCRALQQRIEKANCWCAQGIELLASQRIEKASGSAELAEQSLLEIQEYLVSGQEFQHNTFHTLFQDSITPSTKGLASQVLQRIEDVTTMCDKRIDNLKALTLRPPRPIQTVQPEPGVPLQQKAPPSQPLGGAPQLQHKKNAFHKANTLPKIEIPSAMWPSAPRVEEHPEASPSIDGEILSQDHEMLRIKRGHVLAELIDTERVYVQELRSILMGYKNELLMSEMQSLVPPALVNKSDVLFGNLDEICSFHGDTFLRDLENCISDTELVALCFTQRREAFHRLYSYYCQNMARSEQLRETVGERNMFFQACQLKLGHKLPLAAYLLKPVQRITKYQLLLKDLLRYSEDRNLCKELQEALDCMLVVVKCVNDSLHQVAITGFWGELHDQGDLLMQGSFSLWTDSKKDRLLRLKPMQRHIFLYMKAMLFCKRAPNKAHNTYHFKRYLKMSQIGLTESVKGDGRKFEVWLQGRQEVHMIQAASVEEKNTWVKEIKRVLLDQLAELKGEKIRQYSLTSQQVHRPLRQTSSWESHQGTSLSLDEASKRPLQRHSLEEEAEGGGAWSSDYSNSEDEETEQADGGRYTSLADYCSMGCGEVSMKEGDIVELLKVGCAGWWYVKILGSQLEGWAPSAYLDGHVRKMSHGLASHSTSTLTE